MRRLILIAVALLVPAASHAADARLFLLTRTPRGVEITVDSLPPGQVAVFPLAPDSALIDLVLPVGPGQSASLVRPGESGMLVVRHKGDALQVALRRADGSMQERPTRKLADLAREETRVCVTGGDGSRRAFVVRGGAVAWTDTAGPVMNMFAGKLPFALNDGDWIVQTETWQRPLAAAPAGRMALERGRYLTALATLPGGGRETFIVDLGAAESVVSRAFVPEGQAIEPSAMTEYSSRGTRLLDYQAGGATGPAPVALGHTVFPVISLGGVAVDSLEAQVTDLPRGLGEGVVGILGMDVLRRCARVRLSVPAAHGAASLEFDPVAPLSRPAGECAFSWVSSHVVLPGEIAGRAARWIVDSGAPESFVDSAAVAGEGWARAAAPSHTVHGAGGQDARTAKAVAPTARVGSAAAWKALPVRVARLAPLEALRVDERVPALLGLGELARMGTLELDFGSLRARWVR